MGMRGPVSKGSYDQHVTRLVRLPNPDPKNYRIVRSLETSRGHLVIEIKYHGCTNFEGRKVMLYKNCTEKQLMAQKAIDPHFTRDPGYRSPFARFEPTEEGWHAAITLSTLL